MKFIRIEEVANWAQALKDWPGLRELTPEQLAEAYARGWADFAATDLDLQRFTELDEGIPVEEVLAEMEEMLKQADQGTK